MLKEYIEQLDTQAFFDPQAFTNDLENSPQKIPVFKDALNKMCTRMDAAFESGIPIQQLIYGRSRILDKILGFAWRHPWLVTNGPLGPTRCRALMRIWNRPT